MHPEIEGEPCVIGRYMPASHKRQVEPLTPTLLAEHWIARLAVRAVVARRKGRIANKVHDPAACITTDGGQNETEG